MAAGSEVVKIRSKLTGNVFEVDSKTYRELFVNRNDVEVVEEKKKKVDGSKEAEKNGE